GRDADQALFSGGASHQGSRHAQVIPQSACGGRAGAKRGSLISHSYPLEGVSVSKAEINRPLRPAGDGPSSSVRELEPRALAALQDEELLEAVQRQTFRFFWEGAQPDSGLARDRIPVGSSDREDL